ncbi:MAG: serine/threonine-protein kinase [candidate division Zixibacteria bacterium]|nr:serine/threonine-protein kinase [candidate division Zixibacteria bacterium]
MSKYSSYILFLLITILAALLYVNDFGPLAGLQKSVDDFLCQMTAAEDTRPNIVLVKLDGRAQNEYGMWPWDRDRIADLLAATASGGPKAIAVTFELTEDTRQDSAGHTDILAEQLSWIENIILPYDIALATFRSPKTNNPDYLFHHSLTVDNPLGLLDEKATMQVRKVFLPAEKILQSEPFLGFDYNMPDDDRTLRHQALVMNYEGYYYPSLSLLAAAMYYDVPTDQIKIVQGQKIIIGEKVEVPINQNAEYFINFPKGPAYTTYSAADVLGEQFNYDVLKGKVVLVCVDDPSYTEYFRTPASEAAPEYLVQATVIENLINRNIITPKDNQHAANLLLLFLVGCLCAYFLPQVSLLYRMVILFCGLFILANVNYFLVSSFRVIGQTVYIALELVLFMTASPLLESSLIPGTDKAAPDKPEKKKPVTKARVEKPKSGEPVHVPMRQISSSASDPENVMTEILDAKPAAFHDHQAISLDGEIDETVATPKFVAIDVDAAAAEEKTDQAASPETPTDGPQPEIISPISVAIDEQRGADITDEPAVSDSQPIPGAPATDSVTHLGRYQILGTLGRGAMGHVYKGVDPAINRPVALKTIRLDFVSDPDEMAELKERLFREAQAAGKLSHPNIVTIYDIGSEGHLQYIAMEYLEGQTLEDMIKKKTKFNYRIISQIIIQICSALDYAHERGIVHRDIKPANIMVLSDYRVKVMDFGIARVDSSSMTKTGIAMGTPNYISPEQLQGKAVDHRADLFSLGVVMYEMLLGRRPFRGENITSLIYAILNNEPEKPSNVNPQIPLLFDHIIGRALKKDPQERYQKASDIVTSLFDFVESFAVKK